ETAILARRYPEARIVISGGSGSVMLAGEGDADTAPRLLEALGVDRAVGARRTAPPGSTAPRQLTYGPLYALSADGTRRFAQQVTPDPGGSALTSGLGGRPLQARRL